jgi:hypothetical protein
VLPVLVVDRECSVSLSVSLDSVSVSVSLDSVSLDWVSLDSVSLDSVSLDSVSLDSVFVSGTSVLSDVSVVSLKGGATVLDEVLDELDEAGVSEDNGPSTA